MADTISNYSYIKKDFQTVFPEILEETKKLAAKWDPTISNESDPGVVLLKVNALITDKLSYNIDKNILEAFPESVTQDSNARNLFESLGYFPHWYQSATCKVNIRWIGDSMNEEANYRTTLPRFTMVTDSNSSIVYTLLQAQEINTLSNSQVYTCDAIEGVINTLEINKTTTITTNNLDANNRIYLPDYQIAENGIFITFASDEFLGGNTTTWTRVDNLAIQKLGQHIFKFGVDTSSQTAYIEFPIDIGTLIEEGLIIRYIVSSGVNGNIAAGTLTKMYSEDIFNSNTVSLINTSGALNGKDPETINSMYRNYKKVLGTFNTLVTLRDYINAILQSGLVSNGFVCDRTNDIQNVYTIVTTNYDASSNKFISTPVTAIEEDINNDPLLNAFDLKLYLLQNENVIYNDKTYNNTFNLLHPDDATYYNVKSYISDQKSISHDYTDIDTTNLALILNKFGIKCKIIPKQPLTLLQQESVQKNILQALRTKFNAKEVSFGEEITYENVYETIINADERIKSISLDDFTFTPTYINGAGEEITNSIDLTNLQGEIAAKAVLAGKFQLLEKDGKISYNINKSFDVSPIENIASLSTSVTLSVTPTTETIDENNSLQLKDNEGIILSTPSLKTLTTYSNYVKYQYTGTAVNANTDYLIDSGRVLVLYWKDSKEDTNYKYAYYRTIDDEKYFINPSFNVSQDGSTYINSLIGSTSTYGTGTITDSTINSNIAALTTNVLSGSKQIEVKSQNITTINHTNSYIYFTRNTTITESGKEYYQLTEDDLIDNVYYIKNGEYFFLTTTNETTLVMLGAGTKIEVVNGLGSEILKVPVIEPQLIMELGLSAISESNGWCKTYQADITITAMDQIYISGNGYVGLKESTSSNSTVSITNIPSAISDNYVVYYKQVDDSIFTELPAKSLGWYAQSLCNLNLSYTNAKTLYVGQRIDYTLSDGSISHYTVENTDMNMLANINGILSGDGEQNTTFEVFNKYGQYAKDYLDLYFYTLITPTSTLTNAPIETTVDNVYSIELVTGNGAETNKTITYSDLKLPQGNYILAIQLESTVTAISYTYGSTTLSLYNDYITNADLKNEGVYYLGLTSDGDEHDFVITVSIPAASDVFIRFLTLYKYTVNQNAPSTTLDIVKQLSANYNFDFTYQVPIADLISVNPITGISYLDSNHPYNPFTICQIDFSEDNNMYKNITLQIMQ